MAGLSASSHAAPSFSLTLSPHYISALPLGDTHGIENGIGAGAKLTVTPFKYTEIFAHGDYLSLQIPGIDAVTVLGAGIGAGYRIPISDRMSLSLSGQLGMYRAQYKSTMTGLSASASIGLRYKLRPSVAVGTEVSAAHYSGGDTPLVTGAVVSPGVTLDVGELFGSVMDANMNVKEVQPVFPVLHSWYEKNPFATVEIENAEETAVEDVTVSFYQPLYMSQPTVCAKIGRVEAGEKFDVGLTAFFNERMLDLIERADAQATVTVEWTALGHKQSREFPMEIPVYGRNNMSWDDDRKAASFVSSKDPAALWFAKYVSGIVADDMRDGVPENVQKAMGIFQALDKFGLSYVIDPSSAYSENTGGASIDFLQFPYQTLMYRGGDCDDISILCCSLFEAVGIQTAFITIPGHIYMAFDSGLTRAQAEKAFLSTQNIIFDGDEAWIPLEITLSDEGFDKSWRVGAREWRTADAKGEAKMYKTHDSWKLYPPVNVPGAAIKFTMIDDKSIEETFNKSIDGWVERETRPVVREYEEAIAKADEEGLNTTALKNTLGAMYGRYGLFEKAEAMLDEPIRNDYAPAKINMANIKFARKDYRGALEIYATTLGENPENALALLGIARSCYELQMYDECDDAYSAIREISPELAAKYSYLGAFENREGRSFSLRERLRTTIWPDGDDEFDEYNHSLDGDDEEEEEEDDDEGFGGVEIEEEYIGLMNEITILGTSLGRLKPDEIFADTPEREAALRREQETPPPEEQRTDEPEVPGPGDEPPEEKEEDAEPAEPAEPPKQTEPVEPPAEPTEKTEPPPEPTEKIEPPPEPTEKIEPPTEPIEPEIPHAESRIPAEPEPAKPEPAPPKPAEEKVEPEELPPTDERADGNAPREEWYEAEDNEPAPEEGWYEKPDGDEPPAPSWREGVDNDPVPPHGWYESGDNLHNPEPPFEEVEVDAGPANAEGSLIVVSRDRSRQSVVPGEYGEFIAPSKKKRRRRRRVGNKIIVYWEDVD